MTVSGQESWEPHTTARMQELTAIRVSAVLLTGLFIEPGRQTEGWVKVKLYLGYRRASAQGKGRH